MHSTAPWCNQDLFFLQNALRRGSSFAEVAGFLCRHEGEVREKAKELGIHTVREPCAARRKGSRGRTGARKKYLHFFPQISSRQIFRAFAL
jgi:hypothetical protein